MNSSDTIKNSGSLILEILTEELPHWEIRSGVRKLEEIVTQVFKKNNLYFDKVRSFSTPKRLAVEVSELPIIIPAQEVIKRGPPISKCFDEKMKEPTSMLVGFCKSHQISSSIKFSDLVPLDDNKNKRGIYLDSSGDFIIFYDLKSEVLTKDVLNQELPVALEGLTFQKMMYWGEFQGPFIRPIKSILALLNSEVLNFSFKKVVSSNITWGLGWGHLLHSEPWNSEIALSHAEEYEPKLLEKKVIADAERRLEKIEQQLKKIEEEYPEFEIVERKKVSETVNQLTEYPCLYLIEFDSELLSIPPEVTISEMVEHQKYFPIQKKGGGLLPYFIITVNGEFDDLTEIKKGNLKVLTSRLRDGFFLYQEDLKLGLLGLKEKLKFILYEKTLGSYADKVKRIAHLALSLHQILKNQSDLFSLLREDLIVFTAPLLKADLSSGMVIEFPHLQGVMGSYYTETLGEDHLMSFEKSSQDIRNIRKEIGVAIMEHYQPASGKSDATLPKTPLGILFSLADKLDNFLGLFSVGVVPTGSHDPYALRRQMQGVIRIILENHFSFDLEKFIHQQISAYEPFMKVPSNQSKQSLEGIQQLMIDFIKKRLITVLKDMGYPTEEAQTVLSHRLNLINQRNSLQALNQFKREEKFKDAFSKLIVLLKRLSKILEKNQFDSIGHRVLSDNIDEHLFENQAEEKLFSQYNIVEKEIEKMLSLTKQTSSMTKENYLTLYNFFSHYEKPLSDFFDQVLVEVNKSTIRINRLRLLSMIREQIRCWFDFDQIQVSM